MPIKLWRALFAQELRKSRHDFESIINFVLKFSVSHWVPDVQSYIGKQKGLSTTGKLFKFRTISDKFKWLQDMFDENLDLFWPCLDQFEQFLTSLNNFSQV